MIVIRNDKLDADEAEALAPTHLVISPGPGRPADAGATIDIVHRLAPTIPTLGVCLGHQAIVEAFGGEVGPAKRLVHGKASLDRARRPAESSTACRARSRPAATTRSRPSVCRTHSR